MSILKSTRGFGSVLAFAAALGAPHARATETVVLHAGSSIQVDSYAADGENYRLVLPTLPNDPLLIPKAEVLCIGNTCAERPTPSDNTGPDKTADNAGPNPAVVKPNPGGRLTGKIGVSGSSTIGEKLMPDLITAFASANGYDAEPESDAKDESVFSFTKEGAQDPAATVALYAHKSGDAIPDMIAGKATIGMRSSPATPEDLQAAEHAGWKNLKDLDSEHVLALDGLAIIVNPDNPVTALSVEQIADIFSGKISNWGDVGGLAAPIDLERRDEKSGTTDTFNSLVMKQSKSNPKISFTAKTEQATEDVVTAVARNKNAIGYVGWAYVGNKAHALSVINSCGVPVKPSFFGIKTAEYPLTRRLFLYTNGAPTDSLSEKLLEFALSDDSNKVIDNDRFVSRQLTFLPFDRQAQRVMQVALGHDPSPPDTRMFFKDVQSAQRSSITFHFAPGGLDLDAQGTADLARLGQALSLDKFGRLHFVVAGFASEREAPAAKLRALSEDRAASIAKALENAGAKFFAENVQVKGYGAGAPVACDTTPAEQGLNSRVEVWVVNDSEADLVTN
jgi:phosphate transport system substrate-binding protein